MRILCFVRVDLHEAESTEFRSALVGTWKLFLAFLLSSCGDQEPLFGNNSLLTLNLLVSFFSSSERGTVVGKTRLQHLPKLPITLQ